MHTNKKPRRLGRGLLVLFQFRKAVDIGFGNIVPVQIRTQPFDCVMDRDGFPVVFHGLERTEAQANHLTVVFRGPLPVNLLPISGSVNPQDPWVLTRVPAGSSYPREEKMLGDISPHLLPEPHSLTRGSLGGEVTNVFKINMKVVGTVH